MPIAVTSDSAVISTTEYFLNADSTTASYNTTPTVLTVLLDVNAMVAGDEFRVRVYDKIDGTNTRPIYSVSLVGAQAQPFALPGLVLSNWEVSIQRISATADRTIYWKLGKIT